MLGLAGSRLSRSVLLILACIGSAAHAADDWQQAVQAFEKACREQAGLREYHAPVVAKGIIVNEEPLGGRPVNGCESACRSALGFGFAYVDVNVISPDPSYMAKDPGWHRFTLKKLGDFWCFPYPEKDASLHVFYAKRGECFSVMRIKDSDARYEYISNSDRRYFTGGGREGWLASFNREVKDRTTNVLLAESKSFSLVLTETSRFSPRGVTTCEEAFGIKVPTFSWSKYLLPEK